MRVLPTKGARWHDGAFVRERGNFNVGRREIRRCVGREGRKTFDENDEVSGREMVGEERGETRSSPREKGRIRRVGK